MMMSHCQTLRTAMLSPSRAAASHAAASHAEAGTRCTAAAQASHRRRGRVARWLAAAALVVAMPAQAAWFVWTMVELPMSSGASCGNGTPYRFFVNTTPFSGNTAITFEGGGACWAQRACEGQGQYSATNPDGIPTNYMAQANSAAGGLVTPFSARLDPFQGVSTQGWNLVYMPYCTGDVHTGNQVVVFSDADPAHPRVQHFAGQANVRAAAAWMRQNMGRPGQLMLTGFSAGGVAATAEYAIVRDALAPTGKTTLLADSGPLFNAPLGGTSAQYPSLPLQTKIRSTWGLDAPQGLISVLARTLPGIDRNNMGSLDAALAQKYPNDRFGYMLFQADATFSGFSYYDFYPAIKNEPDPNVQKQMMNTLWRQDIAQWKPTLESQPNVAYWIPFYRDFNNSHCLTIVDFSGTGIEDQGYADVAPFIDASLSHGAVLRKTEADQASDLTRPVSLAMTILSIVLALFG
jgi:hypothetical protein